MINKSILVFFGVLLAFSLARAEVRFPHGEYYENVDDLRVKVLGGFVNAKRTWYQGKWYFNRPWSSLSITYDALDGGIGSIDNNGNVFTRDPNNANLFKFGQTLTITKTATGFRWATRGGNWRDYDTNGRIVAYGDRNNVKVTFQFNANGKLATVKDHHDNLVFTYQYDAQGNVQYIRNRENDQVEYRYSGGKLAEVVDVLGNIWKYTYSGEKIASRTDPENRTYTLTYDANDRVISEANSDGNGSTYVYDYDKGKREYYLRKRSAAGRVDETWFDRDGMPIRRALNGDDVLTLAKDINKEIVADGSGNTTTYEYDQWRNLTKTSYADGSVRSYRYETNFSQLAEKIDENGVKTLYEYDGNGNLIKKTEAAGRPEQRITEYTRDTYGYTLQIKRLGDAVTAESIRTYTYDNYGNTLTDTDPEGGVSRYTYDIMGKGLTFTDPNDEVWTYTYNAAGLITKAVDPINRTTLYGYDKTAQQISRTEADNSVTQFAYDGSGRTIQTKDAYSKSAQTVYDADGLLTETIDELGRKSIANNDLYGRRQSTWVGSEKLLEYVYADDAHGLGGMPHKILFGTLEQEFVYDKRHRITRVIERPNGGQAVTEESQYDPVGNLISVKDAGNRLNLWSYDGLNRKLTKTDALNQVTHYVYDSRNNLIRYTDASNRTTQYEYDRNNRQTKIIRPMGEETVLVYDPAGYLTERRDANGRKIEFTYDAAGQLQTERHYAAVADTTPVKTVTYTYNALGSLTGYDDGVTSAVYTYDNLQRKLSETVDYGPFQIGHQYTYYDNGKKKTYTGPDGITLSYTYDAENRLSGIQIPSEGSVVFGQYRGFLPKQVTYPGGTRIDYGYDNRDRPVGISVKDAADNTLLSLGYQYDSLSRVIQKTDAEGATAYSFDDLDRLTQVDFPTQPDETFGYDPVGNRLSDASGATWNYNLNNELLSHGTTSYGYDNNGNRALKTVGGQNTHYAYDFDNNLAEIKDHSQTIVATYYHDPFGYRLWKDTGGVRTYFHYSDEGLAAEMDSAGAVNALYSFIPGRFWSTAPLYAKRGGAYNYIHSDIIGTPKKLTQANGSVQWAATQKAFGETQTSVSNVENPLRFPGQYADNESGLSENHLRAYDPATGRYLQADPQGLAGSVNLYGYAAGNPVQNTDPHGDIIPYLIYQGAMWAGRTLITRAAQRRLLAGAGARVLFGNLGGSTIGNAGTALLLGGAVLWNQFCRIPIPSPSSDDAPPSGPLQNSDEGAGGDGAGSGSDSEGDNPPAPTPATEGEPTLPSDPSDDEGGGSGDDEGKRKENRERQKGDRFKSSDNPLKQREEIERTQRDYRKGKGDKRIDDITKSKQREKKFLDDLRNMDPKDIDDFFDDF